MPEPASNVADLLEAYKRELLYSANVRRFLEPQAKTLRSELKTLDEVKTPETPLTCDKYEYRLIDHPTSGSSVLERRKINDSSSEETVLNLDLIKSKFLGNRLGTLRISPGESHTAFTISEAGGKSNLLVVASSGDQTELVEGPEQVHALEWGKDDEELFFTTLSRLRADSLWRWKPGKSAPQKILVLDNPSRALNIKRSGDGEFILVNRGSAGNPEWSVLSTKRNQLLPLDNELSLKITDLEHSSGYFYGVGYKQNYQPLLMRRSDKEPSYWSEIELQDETSFPEEVTAFGNEIILTKRGPKGTYATLYQPDTNLQFDLEVPAKFSSFNLVPRCGNSPRKLNYSFSAPLTPKEVHSYDRAAKLTSLISSSTFPPELGIDAKNFTLFAEEAKSRDGTIIPLNTVRPATKPPIGYLVTAYGAYGHSLETGYLPWTIPLLKRDVGLAFCHVRGGGEGGPKWHDQARTHSKIKSSEDLIACAETLRGKTMNAPIAVFARSAGAVPGARAVLDRPDLFNALVLEAPFLDVVGEMSDQTRGMSAYEQAEWGDPSNEKMLASMLRYSPFSIKGRLDLPHILISSGLKDDVVSPLEGLDWILKLRTHNVSKSILAYSASDSADHSGEEFDYQSRSEKAFQLAFILGVLKVD